MSGDPDERYDFFLSRRGSVAAIAREVADVLTDKGYKVFVQDYDIPLSASLIEKMHRGIERSRDLIILFTSDYDQSPYTRREFSSFEAQRLNSVEERHTILLRCEGLFADWRTYGAVPAVTFSRAAYSEADPLFRKALAARERSLGPEYPDTAMSLNNLALLLKDEGDLAGAHLLYERAVRICEQWAGPNHPDTVTSLNNLGCLLRDQKRSGWAKPPLLLIRRRWDQIM